MKPHLLVFLFLIACPDPDAAVEGDTAATGRVAWEDADTTRQGSARGPERPLNTSFRIELDVEGSGDLSGLQPECELEGVTGDFVGLYDGEAEVDGEGIYVATFATSEATFETPTAGCAIPEVDMVLITDVVVRGFLEATQERCTSYCEAKARYEGEQECGAEVTAASCRADAEAEYTSDCETACTTEAHAIVAEARLSADALATVNAGPLGTEGLGAVEADLTFDHLEDEEGEVVEETR